MKILGWFGIALIAVVAVIVLQRYGMKNPQNGVSVQQKTQNQADSTSNWKTYQNTQYGFEIKYPATWAIKSETNNQGNIFTDIYNPQKMGSVMQNGGSYASIPSEYVDLSHAKKSSETAEQIAKEFKEAWPSQNIIIETKLTNGLNYALYTDAGEGSRNNNLTISNGRTVVYMNTSMKSLNGNDIENQILSTFKFTDQNQGLDISTWKTYVSTTEKANFKYPSDWVVAKPAIDSNYPEADLTAFQSPSGSIKVTWVSALSGFGGACDDQVPLGKEGACPLFTLIEKTPIKGAQGFYVVSGTLTKDGLSFEPFLAVQDSKTFSLTSTKRTMGYDMFTGKNNGSLPENRGNNTSALFSTSGAYGGGPSLSQAEATTWFSKPEVQQAKLILSSLTY